MEPGRELDALVAEKVLGWKQCSVEGTAKIAYGKPSDFRDHEPRVRIGDYSTDIAAAWEVVEKMRSNDYLLDIGNGSGAGYAAMFYNPNKTIFLIGPYTETAPDTICKAALLVMIKEDAE
ncbi:hypothetical protein DNH61_11640 [Paenibacillus sambharensis]|uniref:Phage ABA sandwich domain-containing protein n=2 Tax=Paenibacillus sambharensis TaxID=1803190 RepID=A0A2W1LJX4_9BACL|nr:hypothetical protein DNH61_11640 [Paenibacillus sambharensis]